jgi:hypothetical protein
MDTAVSMSSTQLQQQQRQQCKAAAAFMEAHLRQGISTVHQNTAILLLRALLVLLLFLQAQ